MNFNETRKELNSLNDQFIDDDERIIFKEYLENPSQILMEMANVRGIDVKLIDHLPFSFYFSTKSAVHRQHGIRVKLIWNPSKAPADADGYLELHGDYKYVSGSHKYKPTEAELTIARNFFRKYKVLFAAVWEEVLYDGDLQDYFKGKLTFQELLTKFDLSGKQYYLVNHCKNLMELETCVMSNKIFKI